MRQKYGLTERDDATGLDHTWFRKNENLAGRWTSPDPYNGSMNLGDPQSFNRYSYVENEPTNYIDPSGLQESSGFYVCYDIVTTGHYPDDPDGTYVHTETVCISFGGGGGSIPGSSGQEFPGEVGGVGGGGGSGAPVATQGKTSAPIDAKEIERLRKRAQCEEDFADKVFDIFVDNALMVTGIAIAGILTIETIVGAIVAAAAGAVVTARAIYKVYAADRDRQKCIARIG